jgi:serine protease Do
MIIRHFPIMLPMGLSILVSIVLAGTVYAQTEFDAAIALESTLIKVIAEAEGAVVSIARIRTNPNQEAGVRRNPFGRFNWRERDQKTRENPESPDFQPNDFGAGVVLSLRDDPNSRYILTNYHVVKGGPVSGENPADAQVELFVRVKGGHSYYSTIKAADPRSDLAVLEINFERMGLTPDQLKPLKLADNLKVRKGQIVIGLGNPYAIAKDGSASASWGIISNTARHPKLPPQPETFADNADEILHHTGTLLQLDMKLNLGTSGGALLNLKGEFVGLTTSLAAIEGFEAAAGYAIPADERFVRIFEALARGQEVEYGFLGVNPQDVSPREVASRNLPLGQPSATKLMTVFNNSPAARAGLRGGDLVLNIEGRPVLDRRDLMREISLLAPETEARIKIWRNDFQRPRIVTVTLGKWPVINDDEIIATNPRFPRWRGMEVDYPTGRNRFLNRTLAYPDAVLIRKITPDSPADLAGLQSGEFVKSVNGRDVKQPAEFHEALQNLEGEVSLRMLDGREVMVSIINSEPVPNP